MIFIDFLHLLVEVLPIDFVFNMRYFFYVQLMYVGKGFVQEVSLFISSSVCSQNVTFTFSKARFDTR